MKTTYAITVITMLLIAQTAFAEFHTLVRYQCNKTENFLSISYLGAADEEGEALLASAGSDDWNTRNLLEINDNVWGTVTGIKSEERSCQLTDNLYHVVVSGNADNWNLSGRCGTHVSAAIHITQNGKSIYKGTFEGHCEHEMYRPVLTNIKIVPGKPPQLTEVSQDEFFQ